MEELYPRTYVPHWCPCEYPDCRLWLQPGEPVAWITLTGGPVIGVHPYHLDAVDQVA